MKEEDYTKITVEYPLSAAKAFAGLGEQMIFVYDSGEGADMQEKTSVMFGRSKEGLKLSYWKHNPHILH